MTTAVPPPLPGHITAAEEQARQVCPASPDPVQPFPSFTVHDVQELNDGLQHLVVKENGIENCRCGKHEAWQHSKAGWHEVATGRTISKGPIGVTNGRDLAVTAGIIGAIKRKDRRRTDLDSKPSAAF
jgi:hypothetical protein